MIGLLVAALAVAIVSLVYGLSQPVHNGLTGTALILALASFSMAIAAGLALWQMRRDRPESRHNLEWRHLFKGGLHGQGRASSR